MRFEGVGLTYAGRHRGVNGKEKYRNRMNRMWRREYSKQFRGWFDVLNDSNHPQPRRFAKALVVGSSLGLFFAAFALHMTKP